MIITTLFIFFTSAHCYVTFNHINEIECANCKNIDGYYNRKNIELLQSAANRREANFFIPANPVDEECRQQVNEWRNATHNGEMWAIQMIDAWGKAPEGLLHGSNDVPGLYDQCLDSSSENFNAKYCTVYYSTESMHINGVLNVKKSLGILSGHRHRDFYGFYNSYGTCLPQACSESELEGHFRDELERRGVQLQRVSCSHSEEISRFSFGEILFMFYLTFIGTIMLLAAINTINNKKPKTYAEKIINTFCPVTNTKKIFSLEEKEDNDSIKCIHGIRVITMIMVHFCHEFALSLHGSNTTSSYVIQKSSFPIALIVSCASLGVDTFLFISGLLVAFSTLKAIQNPIKIRPLLFYAMRFIRLTPPILIVTFFCATIAERFVTGPWSSEFQIVSNSCRKFWWKDILYLGNVFTSSSDSSSMISCLGQCWYTAVDFQIFLIAPFLLYLVLLYPKRARSIIVATTLLSFAIPMSYIYYNNIVPTNIIRMKPSINDEYYQKIYTKPWHRAAPWLVGFSTGYVLIKNTQSSQKLSKRMVASGWLASVSLAVGILYRMIQMNLDHSTYEQMGPIARAIYGGTHRGLWAVAFAWIVYACQTGQGGVATILEWPGFRPLSRLSYSVFIVSLNTQFALSWSHKTKYHLSIFSKAYEACGSFAVCIFLALALSLITESPTTTLIKSSHKGSKVKNS